MKIFKITSSLLVLHLFYFPLLMIAILSFTSCSNNSSDRIWDISPVVFTIKVIDPNGIDLLNPATPNCVDTSKIKVIYKGAEYKCKEYGWWWSEYYQNDPENQTKTYMPHFRGLVFMKNDFTGIHQLRIGEFDGTQSYNNEEIEIIWENGASDKISFNRKFRWKLNGDSEIKQEWYLNGKKNSSGAITITRI